MRVSIPKLKKLILDSGYVDEKQFDEALQEAKHTQANVADILIQKGYIPEVHMAELLSDYFKVPLVDLSKNKIDQALLKLLPEEVANSKRSIIFGKDLKGWLKVAMEDPGDLLAIEYLKKYLSQPLKIYLTTASNIKAAFKNYKQNISTSFQEIIEENVSKSKASVLDITQAAQDIPVIKIFDTILEYAASWDASDIHIEKLSDRVLIRYRIDGMLRDIIDLPSRIHPALVARAKILANLKIDEHRIPQDGRFKFKFENQEIPVRISIMPTFYGEKIEMRLLAETLKPLNLAELGFSAKNLKILTEAIKKPNGLILATGPTGSGKTTTLYTVLHILNKAQVNISTIEDPIEYDIRRVNQIQVNPSVGLTFAKGLRSLLRQDPDIIMVGEIRDKETANMVIHSALTGHLVLSTMHTRDAASAIPRILDIGVEPYLASSTLNIIIAQRLVRRICLKCIKSYLLRPKEKERLAEGFVINKQISAIPFKMPSRFYRGQGCRACGNSGYKGQIGIFEVLEVTPKISKLISEQADAIKFKKAATSAGMITLLEDGLNKVASGITTLEEIARVIKE